MTEDKTGNNAFPRVAASPSLAKAIRNPLAIFGLVLVAGGGPLSVAYGLSPTPVLAAWALAALIVFVLGMGSAFCYVVIYRPRHLYHPYEIPARAYEKAIYSEAAVQDDGQIRRNAFGRRSARFGGSVPPKP